MKVKFDEEAKAVLIPSLGKLLGDWGLPYEDDNELKERARRILDTIEGELWAKDMERINKDMDRMKAEGFFDEGGK